MGEGWNLGKRRNKPRSSIKDEKPSFKFAPLPIGQKGTWVRAGVGWGMTV